MRVLVTGSAGLIGSEAVEFFDSMGWLAAGVDNNQRADFFGPRGDNTANRQRLEANCRRYVHHNLDVRDREGVNELVRCFHPDVIIHAAAQPSHDLAAHRPFDDFDINAGGTLNLLEACRQHSPEAVFVTLSTNKVYGDGPNRIPLVELETRWDYADARYCHGIDESFDIDQSLHSLFGASKLAADTLTQEYGRYFEMRTGTFRGGCLTGPHHTGVEMHGFLSYLVDCALSQSEYTVYGYKGKQVRDQMHSADVIEALWRFVQDPRPGEVYNLGGGRPNSASILETVELIAEVSGSRPLLKYADTPRRGDHVCYFTDMAKFCSDYPDWKVKHSLEDIVSELVHNRRNI